MDNDKAVRRRFLFDALHIAALCGFAVAQPIYDLIGQNAEFFVAHRLGPPGILAFVAALSLGLPALLLLIEALALRFGPSVQRAVHLVFVFALAAAFMAPLLNRVPSLAGYAPVVLSVLLGGAVTVLYARSSHLRSFATVLSPGIVAFPALFLLVSPVSSLMFSSAGAVASKAAVKNPVPIVVVILDEFEAGSLLDENKAIDEVRFPNFAALARESWWFPHATTAWPETTRAVPAILTGLMPRGAHAVPTLQGHPNNLFTWLMGTYRFNAAETLTALCPEDVCATEDADLDARLFLSDLSIIYLHVILPPAVAQRHLPAMDTGWKGFTKAADIHQHEQGEAGTKTEKKGGSAFRDRAERFSAFIDRITRDEPSTLHFLHILLPHSRYTYLPSGANYQGEVEDGLLDTGLPDKVWTEDPVLPTLAYHRFLLQVGFVDRLVGRLIDRLKSEALYDSALLIITSDHGKSFRPGQPKRLMTAENASDVLPVPLFVKLPKQSEGRRSERFASTVDILPTIAKVIGAELPWTPDGHSLVDPSAPVRDTIEFGALHHFREPMRFSAAELTSYTRLAWKLATFGSRTPLDRTAVKGPHAELLNARVSALPINEAEPGVTFVSEQLPLYDHVDLGSGFVPAHVRGEVLGRAGDTPVHLAVAINGTIAAVTRTIAWANKPHFFSVMIPEASFIEGRNSLELFEIGATSKVVLSPIPGPAREEFKLVRGGDGQETLVSSTGETVAVSPDAVKGYLDGVRSQTRSYGLTGWAFDQSRMKPASAIVVFSGNRQVQAARPGTSRPDLVKAFGDPAVLESGFRLTVDKRALKDPSKLRIFGISEDGRASELTVDDSVRNGVKEAG